MKLNIGCGYNRLEGYVNLDASPDSLADRLMPAHDLDFPAGSVSAIKALQLVEHLGFFRTKYFLSECRRALSAGGTLTLETPHIERTFEIFLGGDHAVKEAALGWVYGSEAPGLNHLYCFPEALLAELLAEAGFEIKKTEEFDFQPFRPALRIEAAAAEGERQALNSALRRRLLDKGLPDFSGEEVSAGQEFVIRRILDAHGDTGRVMALALYSAPIALEYFSLTEENEPRASARASACARLAQWDLQGRLAAEFEAAAAGAAETGAAFSAALERGRELVRSALDGGAVAGGREPAAGAPPVFTPAAAGTWLFKKKARGG